MSQILIAEDEPRIVRFLAKGLQAQGYATACAATGPEALDLALAGSFDLILLDLGLPGLDGLEVLARLRRAGRKTPVIVLTARNSTEDVVTGLDSGASDYVRKPFRLAELLARIRLQLRHEPGAEEFVLRNGSLSLDVRTRQMTADGRTIDLSAREFTMAEFFMRHPGQVLSREQLLSHVWGYDYDPMSNVVEVYVRYLRNKIGPDRIVTVRGAGYRLVREAAPAAG
ncbi:MAG TPA: response regulator transcription factor [Streptosporangiaceae bacterium]